MSILKEATSGFEVQGKELAFFCYISNAYAFKSWEMKSELNYKR